MWANKQEVKLFKGDDLVKLELDVNEWLKQQQYVQVLNSKITAEKETLYVLISCCRLSKRNPNTLSDDEYNEKKHDMSDILF